MSINRKFYFLGIAIYVFSFFLPAIPMFNEPVKGYYCALWVFGLLFKFEGFVDYFFTIFANLANIFTILVFILHFKFPARKLIIFQLIAFISASYWAVLDLVQERDLSSLFIGYWNWLFGIFFILIVMTTSLRTGKKFAQRSQQDVGEGR